MQFTSLFNFLLDSRIHKDSLLLFNEIQTALRTSSINKEKPETIDFTLVSGLYFMYRSYKKGKLHSSLRFKA